MTKYRVPKVSEYAMTELMINGRIMQTGTILSGPEQYFKSWLRKAMRQTIKDMDCAMGEPEYDRKLTIIDTIVSSVTYLRAQAFPKNGDEPIDVVWIIRRHYL